MVSITRSRIRNHIRKTLGPISREWNERTDGSALPFAIAQINDQPVLDAITLVTIGLSEWELCFPSGAPTRQELLFSCYSSFLDANVQGLLGAVALACVDEGRALARGAVEGPAGPLLPSTRLEALYASLPAYFSDRFATNNTTAPPSHFMWIVPITAGEAEFATHEGWSRFEDLLVRQNPDLLDLNRQQLVLPYAR